MINRLTTVLFVAFIITGVMMTPSRSRASGQRDTLAVNNDHSSDTDSRAEAIFQDALRLLTLDQPTQPGRVRAQQAISMWTEARQPEKAARAAVQLADRCREGRYYRDALELYRQALELKSLPDVSIAGIFSSIGLVYADLYARDLSERNFNQALEQLRNIDDVSVKTVTLTALADLRRQEGRLDEASQLISSVMQLRRQHHAGPYPEVLYEQGLVSQEQHQPEIARQSFEEALPIYVSNGNLRGQARILYALSDLALRDSQTQTAIEMAGQIRDLSTKEEKRLLALGAVGPIGDFLNYFEIRLFAYLSDGRAQRAAGRNDKAIKAYSSAIEYVNVIWSGYAVATESCAVAFRERFLDASLELVDLLVAEGNLKEAYRIASNIKGRTLLNFIGGRRLKLSSEDPNQSAELRELTHLVASDRMRLKTPGLNHKQIAKMLKDLEDAEYQMKEVRLHGEMAHFRERHIIQRGAKVEQLQNSLADNKQALAEFTLGEKRSFVWFFSRGEFHSEILPSRRDIEKTLKPYLEELGRPPNPMRANADIDKLKAHGAALYSKLFGSLSDQIEPGQRLIIVADGLLNYLPFDTLVHNGRYLIQDHEIRYSRSATLLIQPESPKPLTAADDKMELLAFGDPDFGSRAGRVVLRRAQRSFAAARRDVRTSRGSQLTRLPMTRVEVLSIADSLPQDRSRIYLGKDSTESAFKRESLHRYRRLHFATHSLVDETSPARSAVALTPDSEEDGFLDVSEISELDLDCDLVVLSACQTGRGQLLSGEGTLGLARAFLYAGAHSVIVSLWSVSDISTSNLMKRLYQHLGSNLSNTEALRLAKLEMLQSKTATRHPYYWAPFICIGNK